MNIIKDIFDYNAFMPKGYCFLWAPEILWTHAIADFTIAVAHFIIAFALAYLIFRRRSIPSSWVFIMLTIFIFFGGVTHLLSLITIWHPIYAIQGLIKILTAASSIGIAFITLTLSTRLFDIIVKYSNDKKEQS